LIAISVTIDETECGKTLNAQDCPSNCRLSISDNFCKGYPENGFKAGRGILFEPIKVAGTWQDLPQKSEGAAYPEG
jgi:hypothetical protein